MATDMEKVRQAAEVLLKENKALNEKDVKAALAKSLKVKAADIGAGLIREVRRKLGIDRPAALAWARAYLVKAPTTDAKTVIEAVAERFGIRLGPPDVTRLRPVEAHGVRSRNAGEEKNRRGEGDPEPPQRVTGGLGAHGCCSRYWARCDGSL